MKKEDFTSTRGRQEAKNAGLWLAFQAEDPENHSEQRMWEQRVSKWK